MLLELNLRNFILIEDIQLSFREGLNIVTGETGAGKSIILEGLRICLGNRTSKDYLRDPNEKAIFEMIFSTPEDFFAISREIFPSGRALSRINGEIVNVDDLQRTIGPYLDIYGQRDHFYLLDPAHQEQVIDSFSDTTRELKQALAEVVSQYQAKRQQLDELLNLASSDISRERAMLSELEALAIDIEADEANEHLFSKLAQRADMLSDLHRASESLERDILSPLDEVSRAVAGFSDWDSEFSDLAQRLESSRIELSDIEQTLRQKQRAFDLDERELKALEERVAVLHGAKRTYQRDLAGLVQYQQELQQKVDQYAALAGDRESLAAELESLHQRYLELSEELKQVRQEVFDEIKVGLIAALQRMELPDVALGLAQTKRRGEPHRSGLYQAEILASMNNRQLKPMKDVLSGGEMSRFILALKQVFSQNEATLTMVFDEIDTGISGHTAFEVGKNIKQLSQQKQVIAITHLPQLTAFADVHYQITKVDATTEVHQLNSQEHVERLALMMSSSRSEEALASARELIARAEMSTFT